MIGDVLGMLDADCGRTRSRDGTTGNDHCDGRAGPGTCSHWPLSDGARVLMAVFPRTQKRALRLLETVGECRRVLM